MKTDSESDLKFLHALSRLSKWKELMQVLHLCVCYKTSVGALTVGQENGTTFYTVFIQFDNHLLQSYTQIVNFLKKEALLWAYKMSETPPWDGIKGIIAQQTKSHYSIEDVKTQFAIWRRLVCKTNDIMLPINRCSRIIPIQHAHWNSLKGVSDTTTKLFDQREFKLATRTKSPSTEACGRIFLAFTVLVHRMSQVFSAQRDIGTYATLSNFCNAAIKRRSFSSTLDGIIDYLKRSANLNATNTAEGDVQNKQTPPRRIFQNKPASIPILGPVTGLTPKKNKAHIPEEVIRANACPGKFVNILMQSKDGKMYVDKN